VKFDDLNNKGKEAFANSLIEVGVSLFKGVMITIFVLPITLIIKSGIDGKSSSITPQQILSILDGTTYLTLLSFLVGAILIGLYFRHEGLRLLNKIEEHET